MTGQQQAIFETENGRIVVDITVADSDAERQVGLMNVESLDPQKGMWFVFEQSARHSFWMKNTLIPLDIVFIDSNMQVVDIIRADPCTSDPCKTYTPDASAQFVLEVYQNFTQETGVKVGNKVKVR